MRFFGFNSGSIGEARFSNTGWNSRFFSPAIVSADGGGGDSQFTLTGSSVSWTDNTFFDNWSSATTTTTDGSASIYNVWQMYFAHRAIKIPAGVSLKTATYAAGSNTWPYGIAIGSSDFSSSSYGSPATLAPSTSHTYVQGGSYNHSVASDVSIPANRYFLIGVRTGPFYFGARNLSEPRTAQISDVPYVTVINRYFVGTSDTSNFRIPTAFGGTETFNEVSGKVTVRSVKFKIV